MLDMRSVSRRYSQTMSADLRRQLLLLPDAGFYGTGRVYSYVKELAECFDGVL